MNKTRTSGIRISLILLVLVLLPVIGSVPVACLSQTVPMMMPKEKALYPLNSQVNWVAFRQRTTDLAVALFGVNRTGKAFAIRSWLTKDKKDTILDTLKDPCMCVAFSADGSQLAWCSWTPHRQIRIAGELGETKTLDCGKVQLSALAFDPKRNSSIATVATDGTVRIWDTTKQALLEQFPVENSHGLGIAYSPDGHLLAACFKSGHVRMWHTDRFTDPATALDAHSMQVNVLSFSPNSRLLATGSHDKSVILWDTQTGRPVQTLQQEHLDPVVALAFSPNGHALASADKSGKVVFWSMDTFKPISMFFPHRQPVYGLAISSDGEWLATGSQDQSVHIFSTRDLGYRLGRLRITGIRDTGSIKVDGESAALDTTGSLSLAPGPHKLVATSVDGSNTKTYSVDLEPDVEKTVAIEIKSAYGKLYVASDQSADIQASSGGSTVKGSANEVIDRLTPGTYRVTITPRDSKFSGATRSIEVRAAETARLTVALVAITGDPSPPTDISSLKQLRVNPLDGAEMIWIPAATFNMGRKKSDRDAKPPHKVTLKGFWMYRTPVTVSQYQKFCEATKGGPREHKMPDPPKWGWVPDHPMVLITWQDAVDYGRWAFGDNRRQFLPTEAQYELAMQGQEGLEYPWGNMFQPDECINSVRPNKSAGTQPVGTRAPDSFGLYDITGNVWEWCADWYDADYYKSSPDRDPAGPPSGTARVVRGGGWNGDNAKLFRSDYRSKADPEVGVPHTGFRCAAGG